MSSPLGTNLFTNTGSYRFFLILVLMNFTVLENEDSVIHILNFGLYVEDEL